MSSVTKEYQQKMKGNTLKTVVRAVMVFRDSSTEEKTKEGS